MASVNDNRFSDLKARVEAVGFELLADDGPVDTRYYVRDPKRGTLVHTANAMTAEGVEHWLEHDAEEAADDDDDTAVERARHDAQFAVYRIDDLVKAALAINGDDDGRIEECLKAASEKLAKLAEDLDGNWPASAGGVS